MNQDDGRNPIFVLNTLKFHNAVQGRELMYVLVLLFGAAASFFLSLNSRPVAVALNLLAHLFLYGLTLGSTFGAAAAMMKKNIDHDLMHFTGMSNWEIIRGYLETSWFFQRVWVILCGVILLSLSLYDPVVFIANFVYLVFALPLLAAGAVMLIALAATIRTQIQYIVLGLLIAFSAVPVFSFFPSLYFFVLWCIEDIHQGEPLIDHRLFLSPILVAGYLSLIFCVITISLFQGVAKIQSGMQESESWKYFFFTGLGELVWIVFWGGVPLFFFVFFH